MGRISILLAALLIAGCATSTRLTAADLRKMQIGVTTEGQALALYGKPFSRSRSADGSVMLVYVDSPTIGIGTVYQSVIFFGPDGKLARATLGTADLSAFGNNRSDEQQVLPPLAQ